MKINFPQVTPINADSRFNFCENQRYLREFHIALYKHFEIKMSSRLRNKNRHDIF